MEMQEDEVVSFKTLTSARLVKEKRWAVKLWFKKLMACGTIYFVSFMKFYGDEVKIVKW